jgi:hypothetical protein
VDPDCQLPNKAFFTHAVASDRAVMLGSALDRYRGAFWRRYARERKEVDILQTLLRVFDWTVRMKVPLPPSMFFVPTSDNVSDDVLLCLRIQRRLFKLMKGYADPDCVVVR